MASALEELVARIKTRAAPDAYCVFDLDRTLWSGDCQKFSKPQELKLYPDVPRIFEALRHCSIPWAVASANPSRQRCLWLLQAHGLLAPGQGFAGIGARLEPGAEIAAVALYRVELPLFAPLPWRFHSDKMACVVYARRGADTKIRALTSNAPQ